MSLRSLRLAPADAALNRPVCVDDPVRHVAAVRRAHDAEPIGIGDALRDQVIDAGHDVLVVALAPRVDDRPLARLAVSGAAARHRKQHRVAEAGHRRGRIRIDLRHEVHELRKEAVGDPAARPAVDVHEQSAAAGPPDASGRRQQQAPDLHAVERPPRDRLQLAEREVAQLGIDVGDRRRRGRSRRP